MPRLHQVSRAEVDTPLITTMYDLLFGERGLGVSEERISVSEDE